MKILQMGISGKAKTLLIKSGYEDVEELVGITKDELMEIKNLDELCADEILGAIREYTKKPAGSVDSSQRIENDKDSDLLKKLDLQIKELVGKEEGFKGEGTIDFTNLQEQIDSMLGK